MTDLVDPRPMLTPLRASPWSTFDADQLVAAGWQWCATNSLWFRVRGGHAWQGACTTCRRRVAWEERQEQDAFEQSNMQVSVVESGTQSAPGERELPGAWPPPGREAEA